MWLAGRNSDRLHVRRIGITNGDYMAKVPSLKKLFLFLSPGNYTLMPKRRVLRRRGKTRSSTWAEIFVLLIIAISIRYHILPPDCVQIKHFVHMWLLYSSFPENPRIVRAHIRTQGMPPLMCSCHIMCDYKNTRKSNHPLWWMDSSGASLLFWCFRICWKW